MGDLVERLRKWAEHYHNADLDEAADEIERLRAPMAKCDLVENEVTGLHNEADLRRIAELEAALREIATGAYGDAWAADIAQQALGGEDDDA